MHVTRPHRSVLEPKQLITSITSNDLEIPFECIALDKEIGSGAYGSIYHGVIACEHQTEPIEVAVKLLKSELATAMYIALSKDMALRVKILQTKLLFQNIYSRTFMWPYAHLVEEHKRGASPVVYFRAFRLLYTLHYIVRYMESSTLYIAPLCAQKWLQTVSKGPSCWRLR